MTVDEYKSKYGEHSISGFWEVRNVVQDWKISSRLYKLLDETIRKIGRIYILNSYRWAKVWKKDDWQNILEIEEMINVAVQGENEEYLREALRLYYDIWLRVIKEFGPIKDTYTPF